MYLMLIFIAIIAILIVGSILIAEPEAVASAIVASLFIGILGILAPLWGSFDNYVDMKKTYKATISQYRGSVKMYENKAVLNLDKSSFTDLKYKGYQKQIADLIKDLREKTVRYNEKYIGKQEYAKNCWFSWYIFPPNEEMKLIRLKTSGGVKE